MKELGVAIFATGMTLAVLTIVGVPVPWAALVALVVFAATFGFGVWRALVSQPPSLREDCGTCHGVCYLQDERGEISICKTCGGWGWVR